MKFYSIDSELRRQARKILCTSLHLSWWQQELYPNQKQFCEPDGAILNQFNKISLIKYTQDLADDSHFLFQD